MRFLRNLLRNRKILSRSFFELTVDWVDNEDPWAYREVEVEPHWLGSRYDFWHYMDGESSVQVSSVDDICAWLAECEYLSDLELFNERDYWQHPLTFERLRRGDCEDHALWAWRKFAELAIPARFVVGRRNWDPEEPRFHAWVTFEKDEKFFLLESVSRDVETMVRPIASATTEYIPHLSVGHFRKTRMYGGLIEYRMWARKNSGRLWNGDRYRPLIGE